MSISFNYNARKIQAIQNRAVKTLFSYKYSTSDSFRLVKVLNISKISMLQVASLVYSCIKSLALFGLKQINLFQTASEYNSYPTTSSENNLLISEMRNSHRGALSLRRFGVEVWNRLPNYINESISLSSFRKNLKKYLAE